MRKSIFTVALALAGLILNAQKLEDVNKALDKKDNAKAKDLIDKITADPNNKNAEAWFVRSVVYNALAVDDKFKDAVPDAYEQAFQAYQKAYDIDPNNIKMKLDAYKSIFLAYEGIANKSAKAYQANNMAAAFEAYKNTIQYGAYLNAKNLSYGSYSIPKVDTGMVFMAGYTAMKLDKKEDAVEYFKRLADANIGGEVDYIIPYQYLAFYYRDKKDEANFKKYTEIGKKLYPKDPYFTTIQLDWSRDTKNYPELFKGYESLIAMQPDSLSNYVSYASEMFEYLFKESETKPANFDELTARIASVLEKPKAADYETYSTHLILSQMYYNIGVEYAIESDKIRSTKPEDQKKKKDLQAKAVAQYTPGIPSAEKVVASLEAKGASMKLSEKANLRNMYTMLEEMYTVTGNKAKADEYKKKYDSVKTN